MVCGTETMTSLKEPTDRVFSEIPRMDMHCYFRVALTALPVPRTA